MNVQDQISLHTEPRPGPTLPKSYVHESNPYSHLQLVIDCFGSLNLV